MKIIKINNLDTDEETRIDTSTMEAISDELKDTIIKKFNNKSLVDIRTNAPYYLVLEFLKKEMYIRLHKGILRVHYDIFDNHGDIIGEKKEYYKVVE